MPARTLATAGLLGLCGIVALAQGAGRPLQGRGGEPIVVVERAVTDRSIPISKETLDQWVKDMDVKKLATLRMIEGGKFNVNIRRITGAETALVHPNTIDTWIVLEGSGTVTTGGRIENGKIVGGQAHRLKAGDIEFIPAGIPHGVSGVDGSITWLNIRWDTDWQK
jgi:quercetin dioxygenase-like cupin family protein